MKAFGPAIPILRIFDDSEARAFYIGYLGFTVEWEHRFEPHLPLYVRISRAQCTLDLSQHYGDGTPGTSVWIPIADVTSFNAELLQKNNPHSRPGIDHDAPGGPTMTVTDPFSNNLRFCQVDR
ncbi:glyoxalase superfamily protein [Rhodococcus sp. 077-4]|uniref:glyoxalase superfamily protein n=1 Tax=Rhodococcus sp. 077-4 TaxID=2789271 RepID=UPI0039F5E791